MADEIRKPLREHLNEKVAALAALQSVSHLTAHESAALPGATIVADYKTVLAQLELEVSQALAAAAVELRKPTVGDLIDRLWVGGPLTFRQIHASVVEAGAPAGEIETLLNRLRNAGLLQASSGPTPATDAAQARAKTLPPTKLLPAEESLPETPPVPALAGADDEPDVTSTYSQLVTGEGREWFNARAEAHGIDLTERIHCQF